LPEANRPRRLTIGFSISWTRDDLPMPEYPETSTSSGAPVAATRSKAPSSAATSASRP
jgi:hypothetical protein